MYFFFFDSVRFFVLLAVVVAAFASTVSAQAQVSPLAIIANLPAACLPPDAFDIVDVLEAAARVSNVSFSDRH